MPIVEELPRVTADSSAPVEIDIDADRWPHEKLSPAMQAFVRWLRGPHHRAPTKDEAHAKATELGVTEADFLGFWPSVHADLKKGRGRPGTT
jgi:hypothetical protein